MVLVFYFLVSRLSRSPHSSGVEHFLGREEVTGSNPVVGSSAIFGFVLLRFGGKYNGKRIV